MPKEHASRFIYSTFLVMATLLLWAWTVNAAHADSAASQLSIAGNGQAMIKGASVISVNDRVIVVSSKWGETQLIWSVETTGSTKFYPSGNSQEMLKALKKGDSVNVTGVLETETGHATIRASAVRNLSLAERLAPDPADQEDESVLPTIPSTGKPAEEPLSGESDNSLLVAATSTALLSWLWRFLYGDPAALALK